MIGPNQIHTENVAFDEVRLYSNQLTSLEAQHLFGNPDPIGAALKAVGEKKMDASEVALRHYYVKHFEPAYARDLQALEEVRSRVNTVMTEQQEVMVMHERTDRRPTYVLNRGQYDAPTERVEPGTPAFLPAFDENLPKNRLGLAKWLTDPSHPLTARVIVNRYWQKLFGHGLVATPDDFGSQGELPMHPELLDWLATSFVDEGWDVKAFMKQLVVSATYRQSSVATVELIERDPANQLLARGPSNRMSAEMIRDNALAVSGLLKRKIGGPSVHPYQPDGLWEELATRNETVYHQDTGANLYRRSMYTIWKRSTPPPSMISFDASERNVCLVERENTSTPLQALVLLNDPQYVEAARVLAERMMNEGGESVPSQLSFAFRLLTSRRPLDHEEAMMARLFEEERTHFASRPEDAMNLLAVGEFPRDPSLDPAEVAARTVVASTLMNFDEAYMKR
jgi:hypothetical protein